MKRSISDLLICKQHFYIQNYLLLEIMNEVNLDLQRKQLSDFFPKIFKKAVIFSSQALFG